MQDGIWIKYGTYSTICQSSERESEPLGAHVAMSFCAVLRAQYARYGTISWIIFSFGREECLKALYIANTSFYIQDK